MKAVIHTQYGSPDVLRLAEVDKPVPRDNQVLIQVATATVNRSDCSFRQGKPYIVRLFSGLTRPKFPILGTEFAGVVVEIGDKVSSFKVGDEVFGRTEDESPGAHGQFLCIDENAAVGHKPEQLSFVQAAALCDGPMLALPYLNCIDFQTSPKILVNGASGSIGSAAVQLAKSYGASVTAVCKTEAIDIVRSLGTDHIIDYKKDDFTQCGDVFDVVFDAVGKSSLGQCRKLLPDGGYYFSTELGFLCQNPLLALRTAVFGGKIKVHFPIPQYLQSDVVRMKQMVESDQYRPVIDRTYPLEQIVHAYEYVETHEKIGNVVIIVDPVIAAADPN